MQDQRPVTGLKPTSCNLKFIDCPQGGAYGPYSDPALAELVLKIVRMTTDEEATLEEVELNPWGKELNAGMKPFMIAIESHAGQVTGTKIELTWPPYDQSCKVEERMGFVSYFVWARSQGEAVKAIGSLSRQKPIKPDFDLDESDFPQEEEESDEGLEEAEA